MTLAVIGGSGLYDIKTLAELNCHQIETPYGQHALPLREYSQNNHTIFFVPRHGAEHKAPPHKVNYRANLWALKSLGVSSVIAFNVVGGIGGLMSPGSLVVPDQIIDYTYGREHTFSDGQQAVNHIDFTFPYTPELREQVLNFLVQEGISHTNHGVYGCTQGPRLESAAEVKRLKRDGCDLVGMTAMPEAALAKELGFQYASLCIVVNWAAGLTDELLSINDIMETINNEIGKVCGFMPRLIEFLQKP